MKKEKFAYSLFGKEVESPLFSNNKGSLPNTVSPNMETPTRFCLKTKILIRI